MFPVDLKKVNYDNLIVIEDEETIEIENIIKYFPNLRTLVITSN